MTPPLPGRGASRLRGLATVLFWGGAYFGAAKIGLQFAVVHPNATVVWPPTGIALAALLLLGPRVWPAIALGAFLANVTTAGSVATSAGIAAGNTLEGLLGAWLVKRFAGGREVLRRPRDIFRFLVLAAGLSTLVSATVGVGSLTLGGFSRAEDFARVWTRWWLGDAVGAVMVTPALLLWASGGPVRWPRRRLLERAVLSVVCLGAGVLFFRGLDGRPHAPLDFLWVPVLLWVAYRYGQRAGATASLMLAVVTLWGTTRGVGPFVLSSTDLSLVVLQGYLAALSAVALLVATIEMRRESADRDSRQAHALLEQRVRDRTAELESTVGVLNDVIDARRAAEAERQRLERELAETGDRERQRLGRALQEDLGQSLVGLTLLASRLERMVVPSERAELARRLREELGAAIAKIRALSQGLAPVPTNADGTVAALLELALATERESGVPCTLDCEETSLTMDGSAASGLYRIAREAIRYLVQRRKARRLAISLAGERGHLSLVVRGSDAAPAAGTEHGLEVKLMSHRAELLGGSFEIDHDDRSLTLRCRVPISPQATEEMAEP